MEVVVTFERRKDAKRCREMWAKMQADVATGGRCVVEERKKEEDD